MLSEDVTDILFLTESLLSRNGGALSIQIGITPGSKPLQISPLPDK